MGRVEAEDLKALVDGLPKRQWKTPKGGNRAGVSDSYARKTITYLRSVFDYAVERDLITKNPARRQVVKLKTPLAARKPLKKVLAPDDGERILAQLDTREDRLIVRVALVCALRPSEIFALKRNDVQLQLSRMSSALRFTSSRTVPGELEDSTGSNGQSRHFVGLDIRQQSDPGPGGEFTLACGGAKNIYIEVTDGQDRGWVTEGTWNAPFGPVFKLPQDSKRIELFQSKRK